jgi:hypothetical protein
MATPLFFVIARVVSRDGALEKVCPLALYPLIDSLIILLKYFIPIFDFSPVRQFFVAIYWVARSLIWILISLSPLQWRKRLVGLCAVSKTEPYSNSYYWGHDLDGAPDTLWGLEGYYHPVGFFMSHISSDTFKEEMKKVDEDKLLRNVQGLGSPDYDLHHYDESSGFVKRMDDANADCVDSAVVVVHFWAQEGRRKELLAVMADYADKVKAREMSPSIDIQSFLALKELNDLNLASLYIR